MRVDADGAVLYWDAPTPVEGPVDLEAWVEGNLGDAPPDFPMNEGTVRRVRLEWCEWLVWLHATGVRLVRSWPAVEVPLRHR